MSDIIGGHLSLRSFDASTAAFEFAVERRFQNLCEGALEIGKDEELSVIVGLKNDLQEILNNSSPTRGLANEGDFKGLALVDKMTERHILMIPVNLSAMNVLSNNLQMLLGHGALLHFLGFSRSVG